MLPKFNEALKNSIREELGSRRTGCEALIIQYYPKDRTADVVVTAPNSQRAGEMLRRIPTPLNLGVQGVDPMAGQMCYVSFKDGNPHQAYVTSLFPTNYSAVEKRRHESAIPIVPRFLDRF